VEADATAAASRESDGARAEYLALLARLGKAEHVKAASGFVYRIPERGAPQPKANARK
jgi:hypothetical protein